MPVWVLVSFGRPYACLHTQIYSTSFRKDLHLLLNEKRHVQKINVTLFICGWSTHRQISSERHSSITWLFACSWHYSSVRVSPPRACGRGCHGYQALCITVMSTDSPLKCHWTRNGCCNPAKPHLALDGHCFVLWVISCLCMWCYPFCALSVAPLSQQVCMCVNCLFHIKLSLEWWAMISACMPVTFNWSFNYITTHAVHCLFHRMCFLSVISFFVFFLHIFVYFNLLFLFDAMYNNMVCCDVISILRLLFNYGI